MSRWPIGNSADWSARGPGFNTRLWQLFLCRIVLCTHVNRRNIVSIFTETLTQNKKKTSVAFQLLYVAKGIRDRSDISPALAIQGNPFFRTL